MSNTGKAVGVPRKPHASSGGGGTASGGGAAALLHVVPAAAKPAGSGSGPSPFRVSGGGLFGAPSSRSLALVLAGCLMGATLVLPMALMPSHRVHKLHFLGLPGHEAPGAAAGGGTLSSSGSSGGGPGHAAGAACAAAALAAAAAATHGAGGRCEHSGAAAGQRNAAAPVLTSRPPTQSLPAALPSQTAAPGGAPDGPAWLGPYALTGPSADDAVAFAKAARAARRRDRADAKAYLLEPEPFDMREQHKKVMGGGNGGGGASPEVAQPRGGG
jgi:hypothetical protein